MHADIWQEECLARLRLMVIPGLGLKTQRLLLERFETARAVLQVSRADLMAIQGLTSRQVSNLFDATYQSVAEQQWEACRHSGIDLILDCDEQYPPGLLHIYDPPILLFRKGSFDPGDALALAVVGTRHPSTYGVRQAERLATGLAKSGFVLISGLARGIDASVHRATLNASGRTIAVLAGGLDEVYPPEHGSLAEEIATRGALYSEMPLGSRPRRGCFPRRNRLISGMSLGVIVVEAMQRSGALVTANHAVQQNREVFAVPGPIDSRASRGCHQLIQQGAQLIQNIEDIIGELGPLAESISIDDGSVVRNPAELSLNEIERAVLRSIETTPAPMSRIVDRCQLPIPRVLATVSVLELKHLVRRVSGDRVVRL